jgi:hypothetical protein
VEEFDLYVAGFFPSRGESPEAGLAKIFGIDEKQARALVRSLPRVIKKRVPADQVERYMRALRDIGADVELRRSALAAQKVVAIGSGDTLRETPEQLLTVPPPDAATAARPSATSQTMVLFTAPAPSQTLHDGAPAPAPMPAPMPEPAPAPAAEPVVEAEPAVEPAPAPASPWADLDLPVRGARISIKPPRAEALTSPLDAGIGAHGRPAWMVENSQYDDTASAPEVEDAQPSPLLADADADVPEGHEDLGVDPEPAPPPGKPASVRPPQRASRAATARVSALSAPALRGRETSRASAYTGDYTRPVDRREVSWIQKWAVRIAVRLGVAMAVFGVAVLARSLHVLGDDVDAAVAEWAAPLDATQASTAEVAAARSGVSVTAREWSSSTVNQWSIGNKDTVVRLIARLDAAGAKGVYPSDVAKTGALSIAAELRVELPTDASQRRAIDAVLRDFMSERSGVRSAAPEGDDDPFHGGTTTFLRLN